MSFFNILKEPLNETTRKKRRSLLLSSLVGITIAKAKIFPTEISAIGVKFSGSDNKSIVIILIGVIVYFLISFIVYAYSEIVAINMARLQEYEQSQASDESGFFNYIFKRGQKIIVFRLFYEILIPIALSIASIIWLNTAEIPQHPPKYQVQECLKIIQEHKEPIKHNNECSVQEN